MTGPSPPTGSGSGVTRVDLGLRADLGADCANCFGLCCVALAFARSADFALDKPAGDPCPNLEEDFRCRIHPHLRDRGFKGCTVFDCYGAGQKVSQHTFANVSWRDDAAVRDRMFAVFPRVRRLHELLWYLDSALALAGTDPLRPELEAAFAQTEALTRSPADDISDQAVEAQLDAVRPLLLRASAAARAVHARADRRRRGQRLGPGAQLLGARLRGADLRGADLRGSLLIAADLHDADLRGVDLLGADLRDADLTGADLSAAIFLTQMQVNSARGDSRTRLPHGLLTPTHW